MLEKDCNGNPISTFPPCYAFQMIFTALAPRLIQSISLNVHNENRALKQLCGDCKYINRNISSKVRFMHSFSYNCKKTVHRKKNKNKYETKCVIKLYRKLTDKMPDWG